MGVLRSILKTDHPVLFDALERSWNIALDEWLPALQAQLDSYNSISHQRNLENHLERILASYHALHPEGRDPLLTPTEIYVLLSAVLFHDIGRAMVSAGHGEESAKFILDKWANLGIPSEPFARTIARVSRFHDVESRDMSTELTRLRTVSIDPFGDVRETRLGALLTLVDHMDSTYARVLPEYLKSTSEIEIVGAFRQLVNDVKVDLTGGLVKVSLGGRFEQHLKTDTSKPWIDTNDFTYSIEGPQLRPWLYDPNAKSKDPKPAKGQSKDEYFRSFIRQHLIFSNRKRTAPNKKWLGVLSQYEDLPNDINRVFYKQKNLYAELFSAGTLPKPDPLMRLMVRHWVRPLRKKAHRKTDTRWFAEVRAELVRLKKERIWWNPVLERVMTLVDRLGKNPMPYPSGYLEALVVKFIEKSVPSLQRRKQKEWPLEFLLAVILADTDMNKKSILSIQPILASMGLPVQTWVLEYNQHLYDEYGNETIEPIFTIEYLLKTLNAMWHLSTQIFAQGEISYQMLSDEMADPHLEKVTRAVHRIAILATDQGNCPVRTSAENWCWKPPQGVNGIETSAPEISGQRATTVRITDIRNRIVEAEESCHD